MGSGKFVKGEIVNGQWAMGSGNFNFCKLQLSIHKLILCSQFQDSLSTITIHGFTVHHSRFTVSPFTIQCRLNCNLKIGLQPKIQFG